MTKRCGENCSIDKHNTLHCIVTKNTFRLYVETETLSVKCTDKYSFRKHPYQNFSRYHWSSPQNEADQRINSVYFSWSRRYFPIEHYNIWIVIGNFLKTSSGVTAQRKFQKAFWTFSINGSALIRPWMSMQQMWNLSKVARVVNQINPLAGSTHNNCLIVFSFFSFFYLMF